MWRLGICAPIARAEAIARAGFAYIELALADVAAMEEAQFQQALETLRATPIRAEAFNLMLPGTMPVVGQAVRYAEVSHYLYQAVSRAARMGARIIVFGSGRSRAVPEGFSRERAYEQLVEYLHMAGDICGGYGITIAIEPLNRAECNILNSVAEATWLVMRTDHPNVRVLADLYHIAKDGENLHEIRAAGRYMQHAHIANPNGRIWPMPGDGYDYRPFADALHDAGYTGRVSIEASTEDFEGSLAAALSVLRAQLCKEHSAFTATPETAVHTIP